MKIIVENKNNINICKLPNYIEGNYWIIDENFKNLLNVVEENGKWLLKSNTDIKITKTLEEDKFSNINYIDSVVLEENMFYYAINIMTKDKYILYTLPNYENFENLVIDYNQNNNILIGKGNKCDVGINNNLICDKQISIEYDKKNNGILIKNLDLNNKLFINNNLCNEKYLSNGDVIFIAGVFMYFFGSLLLVSNNKKDLMFNSLKINKRLIKENPTVDYSNLIDKDVKFFDKDKYYQRPPRFKRKIENKIFNIDAPTQKEKQEEMPLVFTIAPMITMGMTSLVTGITALQRVLDGKSTIKDEFSSLLMCGCMMLSMILFPLAQKFYTKMKRKEKERKRRRKYKKYIDSKRDEIFKEINYQKQVLVEDNLPMDKVREVIVNRTRNLWERKLEHDDFLELRLGIGTKKPEMDIKYPEEHFTLEEDDLKDIIKELVDESKDIENVPITLNFRENNKVGIIGEKSIVNKFYDALMLQIMAYHGYDMLRLVILTNDKNKGYWEKFRNLTYLWNNNKSIRYYGTNKDDINKITSFLMEEYNFRKEMLDENKEMQFIPYYLILTDDIVSVKNNVFVSEILKSHTNLGYSIIMSVDKLDLLPNEASMFINVDKDVSGIFSNQMTMDNQIAFIPDLVNFSLKNLITNISNVPMDINSGKFVLPTKYSFLEMFDVGNVNQLNILNRWKNNNIIKSLETPVGIDEQGELFKIDLHEKAHGPHGLVAGTTGSGKSEWIITYILSMAVNYSPEEVQFVLIDYKGGGLALTFDNRETGVKLPHVVGTLTNLDVVEMQRSLASIASELKRRQAMFKRAREQLNESSMDIYKYQELYRAGKLSEPMSHLFIISDEFAELKSQQPEFMDELISTARIGRSLGIHLILATQKPSGVVNDQIWSNSKFKVCLKVQDKADSNDMLKRPDAAMLKDTGRFYFQVGYNEFFALGQSAYAGMPYYESDKKITLVDSTIDFVNNIGAVVKKGNVEKTNTQFVHKGEELPNVLNYIIDTANTQDLKITPLWLSRIPEVIYVDRLKTKYDWKKEDYILNPIIGEYDNPGKQEQGLLTIPISYGGNTIIYGSSGSGKENLITTLIYSLITNYTPHEVAIYILDFGSGVLNNFKDASHVGDIIHNGDDEKLDNLFKFLKNEISIRRNEFLQYNGNYLDFIKNSQRKVPNIILIINLFDVFSELYNDYSEIIADISRDCAKYGIYLLLANGVSSVKTRISQNFKQIFCLQLNDEYQYSSLLGKTNIMPFKFFGRGLVKLNQVYEFQTAFAYEREDLYKNISKLAFDTFIKYKYRVKSIPILPDIISYSDINIKQINYSFLPIGIIKQSLSVASIQLEEIPTYMISFRSFDKATNFIDKFLYILNANFSNVFVFDAKFLYEENKYNSLFYENINFSEQLKKISDFSLNLKDVLKNNNNNYRILNDVNDVLCLVIGFEKFVSSLSSEDLTIFQDLIKSLKDIYKIHFIFMDIPINFKKFEYEPWFKDSINFNSGLWIGDGFAEQNIIRPTKMLQSYYDIINNNFGYLLDNGQVEFVKLIEKE